MSRLWIDLDNAPHVPLFRPLIREFESRGHAVRITIRDFGYTAQLAERAGMSFTTIGKHPGGNKIRKVVSLAWRAQRLAFWAATRNFDVALSHGSRGLVVGARLANIPVVTMLDYEHVSRSLFSFLSSRLIVPDALRSSIGTEETRYYAGYKEEIYLGDFSPNASALKDLPIPNHKVLVVARPPATDAHYHERGSEEIFRCILDRVAESSEVFCIVVPRTPKQAAEVAEILVNPLNFHILERPVDGLDLIWQADLVIGGGGTMNREAALLGVPVFSIFTGPIGSIDLELSVDNRLKFVRSVEDVTQIKFTRRNRPDTSILERQTRSKELVSSLVDEILDSDLIDP